MPARLESDKHDNDTVPPVSLQLHGGQESCLCRIKVLIIFHLEILLPRQGRIFTLKKIAGKNIYSQKNYKM